jgi:hypothetical protein
MRLVLLGLAEVRISPADEHVLALDSRHDAYVILAAAPYRHLHSQLDSCLLLSALHLQKPLISSSKGPVYTGRTAEHLRLLLRSLIAGHRIEVRFKCALQDRSRVVGDPIDDAHSRGALDAPD